MRVFDEFQRFQASPASHAESLADFLNRAHTPYWETVRTLIEAWFGRLPEDTKADVRARLRSSDNRQFHAAFWELYLHEMLVRGGYRVTCHPPVEGTSRRPDFLAEAAASGFYIEARVASESDDQVTAERRRRRVYDALDRTDSPNFFLWVDVEGEGSSDLGTKPLRKELESWLATLDPDDIHRQLVESEDITSVPAYEWKSQDWHLVFRPWPKAPESRGSDGIRPLGVFGPGSAHIIDDVGPLKKALSDKGSAYGSLARPYVLAIRSSSLSVDEFDVLNALYGTLQVQFGLGPAGETATREVRAPDGYWSGEADWKHRNVSGVLIAHNLQPWTVAMDVPTLWEHPDPERPIRAAAMWRRAIVRAGKLEYRDPSVLPHDLFQLPADWPGGEPFEPYSD